MSNLLIKVTDKDFVRVIVMIPAIAYIKEIDKGSIIYFRDGESSLNVYETLLEISNQLEGLTYRKFTDENTKP